MNVNIQYMYYFTVYSTISRSRVWYGVDNNFKRVLLTKSSISQVRLKK